MPSSILFPEFRAEYEQTRYPFADQATLSGVATATPAIAPDLFLDGSLYLVGNSGRLHLAQIQIASAQATLLISDATGRRTATAAVDLVSPPDLVHFQDPDGRDAGLLVSEASRLASFGAWPAGLHTFTPAATEFAAAVVIPMPESGVLAIVSDRGDILTGDVWLVGDRGIVLREEAGDVRVDIVGDPLFLRRLCSSGDRFQVPQFIRTLNNCPPDQSGNYNLTVGDHLNSETILRIYPTETGLTIEATGQTIRH